MQRLAILAPIKGDDDTIDWEQAEYDGSTSWPPIDGGDWCGEFKEEEMTHKPEPPPEIKRQAAELEQALIDLLAGFEVWPKHIEEAWRIMRAESPEVMSQAEFFDAAWSLIKACQRIRKEGTT